MRGRRARVDEPRPARRRGTRTPCFGDFVAGDGPLPEEQVEVSLRSQALSEALAALLASGSGRCVVLRYGLDDAEPKTLEEIGRRLGLTRERVRQIELESLRRLASLREMESVEALSLGAASSERRPVEERPRAVLAEPFRSPRPRPRRGAAAASAGARRRRRPPRAPVSSSCQPSASARPVPAEQATWRSPAAASRRAPGATRSPGSASVASERSGCAITGMSPCASARLAELDERLARPDERHLHQDATGARRARSATGPRGAAAALGVSSKPSRSSRPATGASSANAARTASSRSGVSGRLGHTCGVAKRIPVPWRAASRQRSAPSATVDAPSSPDGQTCEWQSTSGGRTCPTLAVTADVAPGLGREAATFRSLRERNPREPDSRSCDG